MNRFAMICKYCDYHWEINYVPHTTIYCPICKDSNIRTIDLHTDIVDYYKGCPPFEEEKDDGQRITMEDVEKHYF